MNQLAEIVTNGSIIFDPITGRLALTDEGREEIQEFYHWSDVNNLFDRWPGVEPYEYVPDISIYGHLSGAEGIGIVEYEEDETLTLVQFWMWEGYQIRSLLTELQRYGFADLRKVI